MKLGFSFDGGGVRGEASAIMAKAVGPLDGHLYVGTSTGGIIAAMLAYGYNEAQILEAYKRMAPKVFKRQRRKAKQLYRARYSNASLQKFAKEIFGNALLGDLQRRLMLTAFRPKGEGRVAKAVYLKSWKHTSVPLMDAVMATTAAPVYLPGKRMDAGDGHALHVDGGVGANNPMLETLAEMHRLWPGEHMKVLSFGTGECTKPSESQLHDDAGLMQIGPMIGSMFMDAQTETRGYLFDFLPIARSEVLRLQFPIHEDIELDETNTRKLDKLRDAATAHIELMGGRVADFLSKS